MFFISFCKFASDLSSLQFNNATQRKPTESAHSPCRRVRSCPFSTASFSTTGEWQHPACPRAFFGGGKSVFQPGLFIEIQEGVHNLWRGATLHRISQHSTEFACEEIVRACKVCVCVCAYVGVCRPESRVYLYTVKYYMLTQFKKKIYGTIAFLTQLKILHKHDFRLYILYQTNKQTEHWTADSPNQWCANAGAVFVVYVGVHSLCVCVCVCLHGC